MRRIPWLIVAPSLVLAQQALAYALVPWACAHQTTAPLHAAFAVTLVLVAAGVVAGWRTWRELRVDKSVDAEGGTVEARNDFLALTNALVSLVAALVVVAQWIGVFVLSPCH